MKWCALHHNVFSSSNVKLNFDKIRLPKSSTCVTLMLPNKDSAQLNHMPNINISRQFSNFYTKNILKKVYRK